MRVSFNRGKLEVFRFLFAVEAPKRGARQKKKPTDPVFGELAEETTAGAPRKISRLPNPSKREATVFVGRHFTFLLIMVG